MKDAGARDLDLFFPRSFDGQGRFQEEKETRSLVWNLPMSFSFFLFLGREGGVLVGVSGVRSLLPVDHCMYLL